MYTAKIIETTKAWASKIAVKNPFLWCFAWKCLNIFPHLLPHDNSYWALKHFCSNDTDLFLDIGANTGISALSFRKVTKKVNKSIPILSIEPNSLHEKALSKLKEKLAPFSFLLLGVSSSTKQLKFYTPVYKNVALHTFTSSSKEQVYDAVKKIFGERISSKLKIEEITAKIVKIDDLEINPTIIKIDTEGGDYQAILGAKETLEKNRPFIMIEVCWSSYMDIANYFKENNYSLLNYCRENEWFIPMSMNTVATPLEGSNIFAVPLEKMTMLPIKYY